MEITCQGSFVLFISCLRLSRLFIDALWSPAGKGLTSWLLFLMFNYVFVTFQCGLLGQVWYLIVLIPNLCQLSYIKLNILTIHEILKVFTLSTVLS